jgi:hypothetical protein
MIAQTVQLLQSKGIQRHPQSNCCKPPTPVNAAEVAGKEEDNNEQPHHS